MRRLAVSIKFFFLRTPNFYWSIKTSKSSQSHQLIIFCKKYLIFVSMAKLIIWLSYLIVNDCSRRRSVLNCNKMTILKNFNIMNNTIIRLYRFEFFDFLIKPKNFFSSIIRIADFILILHCFYNKLAKIFIKTHLQFLNIFKTSFY